MKVIRVRNVHEALPEGIYQLLQFGLAEETRNGMVMAMPEPVTTVYTHPRERVLFWPERDANPFFHFYEALWMLGGRDDVASLTRFVKGMSAFSDDDKTFHGAYGERWRHHFKLDQLANLVTQLRANPSCRRQVLAIFDGASDVVTPGYEHMKDIPCNLAVHFMVRSGALDMTVFNRSNDIIWGAYGANAVHFSMLQEFIATMAGLPVGMYWQVSDNFHAYDATLDPLMDLASRVRQPPSSGVLTPYEGDVTPFPLVQRREYDRWMGELAMFLDEEHQAIGYTEPFFRHVALPMVAVHNAFKAREYDLAKTLSQDIKATDWRLAAQQWLHRREAKREQSKSAD